MVTTIKQKTLSIRIELDSADALTVRVRRMAWKPAQLFLSELAKLLSGAGANAAMAAGESPIQQLTTRLPELLDRSTGLIDFLLENSTDLTPKTIGELDAGVVAELVRIAIELNLDAEVKNSCAGIAAVVVGPVPALGTKSPTT